MGEELPIHHGPWWKAEKCSELSDGEGDLAGRIAKILSLFLLPRAPCFADSHHGVIIHVGVLQLVLYIYVELLHQPI